MATVNDVGQDIEKYVESEVKENANSVDFPEDEAIDVEATESAAEPSFLKE